ncbi:MAG: nucleotidyltransferase domain-containing protein, partial [Coriobacteriales bacterium]|nr:nucleotidyltransferase domain-containing protein [Coriobacteriales bacterium]
LVGRVSEGHVLYYKHTPHYNSLENFWRIMATREAVSRMNTEVETQLNTITETIVETIPVEQIYLFGSYAHGEPNEDSDLDIFVVIPDDTGREIDITIDLRKAIRGKKSMPVDLLVSSLSRFRERITTPTLERDIYEQGQLIYG